jgi:serine/threonine-protein kinase
MSVIPLQRIEGKYEILGKLREGGMGAIYKVRHRLLDEVCVIKLMRPHLVGDEELRARFLREARLAIKLRHPNIAQLYDFTVDEEDGTAFIVMEYISGKTLQDVLAQGGPPPLGLTLEIARQSLRALGYLHGKGLIHRDISPDNLMISEDTEGQPLVKLLDLGIAKILGGGGDGLTQSGTFLGKVRYSSPEQFSVEGSGTVDARGDLYSFGIVLYELLTGRFPIAGRDPSSLIAGHLFRPPLDFAESDPTGRVPAGLRQAVRQALEKKPGDRFASALDFSRALEPFRAPGDADAGDLRRLWSLSSEADVAAAAPQPPGTTQERLDEHFGLEGTATLELRTTAPKKKKPAGGPRAAALEAAVSEIDAALERRDLDAAGALLDAAVARFGAEDALRDPWQRLEAARRDDAAERPDKTALAAARKFKARGDLGAAMAAVEQVLAADPNHREARSLRIDLEAARLRRELEARVKTLLTEARRLESKGDLEGAAKKLRSAASLDAGNAEVHARIAALDSELHQGKEGSLAQAVAAISGMTDRRNTDRALKALHDAEARYGHHEELDRLRKRLADLVLED